MKWFRFYNEVLDDPKVQCLTPELFKFWVNILCITSKNDGVLPNIEAISYHIRATQEATQSLVKALLEAQLLQEFSNQHGTWLAPHAWAKRQYKSDVSTDRVKRFRNAKRNDIATPPETETETETEQKETAIKIAPSEMLRIWQDTVQPKLTSGIVSLSDKRKKRLNAIMKDRFKTITNWEAFCKQIVASPFLTGNNDRKWKVTIDWALKEENMNKILEGNYSNKVNVVDDRETITMEDILNGRAY